MREKSCDGFETQQDKVHPHVLLTAGYRHQPHLQLCKTKSDRLWMDGEEKSEKKHPKCNWFDTTYKNK